MAHAFSKVLQSLSLVADRLKVTVEDPCQRAVGFEFRSGFQMVNALVAFPAAFQGCYQSGGGLIRESVPLSPLGVNSCLGDVVGGRVKLLCSCLRHGGS